MELGPSPCCHRVSSSLGGWQIRYRNLWTELNHSGLVSGAMPSACFPSKGTACQKRLVKVVLDLQQLPLALFYPCPWSSLWKSVECFWPLYFLDPTKPVTKWMLMKPWGPVIGNSERKPWPCVAVVLRPPKSAAKCCALQGDSWNEDSPP